LEQSQQIDKICQIIPFHCGLNAGLFFSSCLIIQKGEIILTNHYKEAHDPSSLSPIHHQQGEIAGSLREIIQSTVHESNDSTKAVPL